MKEAHVASVIAGVGNRKDNERRWGERVEARAGAKADKIVRQTACDTGARGPLRTSREREDTLE